MSTTAKPTAADVAIIDYGMGNLASVKSACEEVGAVPQIIRRPEELSGAKRIILPGVGAFGDGIAHLRNHGWIDPLKRRVMADKIPLLGICLGMQLLSDYSEEGGHHDGLGLIPGRVIRLIPKKSDERVPHIGWNEIAPIGASCPLFADITAGTDVYFVHSYHFQADDRADITATTPYAGGFVSAMARDNIHGVQFHPEKSAVAGLRILRNFMGET